MNILYLTTSRTSGERAHNLQIKETMGAMRTLGASVEIVAPHPLWQNLLYLGKVGYWLRTIIFIFWAIVSGRTYSRDVLYLRDPFGAWLLTFVCKRVVLELHDISSPRLARQAAARAMGIVAISSGLAKRLEELGIEKEKVTVAHDGVDPEQFDIAITKEVAQERLGLPQGKKIVMYAGLFDKWKGHDVLLEASKEFSPNILLVMLGGRSDQVLELKTKYGGVHFAGWLPYAELGANLRAADVLVLPNSGKYEISRLFTSPLKLFAYMASGVPIVASDLPSIREVLDESSALLVSPDDPHSLAEGIMTTLLKPDRAEALARVAKTSVGEYTWDKRAHVILTHINKLIALHASNHNHPHI